MAATSLTRAVLLNLGVFLVDNNIRRNTGSYTFNYTSNSGSTTTNVVTVPPNGGTYSWTTPSGMNPSLLTLIVASSVITASITLRNATSFNVNISNLFSLDDDVAQVVLTNSTTVPVRVTLQQI